MNIKNNLIFFFATFPVFIFHSNFNFQEITYIILIFLAFIILNYLFVNYLYNKKFVKIDYCYLALVITYGFDNHFGLFNGLITPNLNFLLEKFRIIYIPSLLVLIFIFILIIFLINKLDNHKFSRIFLVTFIVLLIFNIFDDTKNYKKVPYFSKDVTDLFDTKTIILIWDEMSGLSSLSSSREDGKRFNQEIIDFFDRYNFEYYTNAFSISENSINSISSLLNYDTEVSEDKRKKYVATSNNYYSEYKLKSNKLFEKFKSISVFQNIHINYCKSKNVTKCYQYNPFKLDLIKAETNKSSKIISLWNLNGSIISKLILRTLKQFNLIQNIAEPEGEKIFINEIMNSISKDILSNKFDLVFVHLLVPHKPYGFNENCNYDINLSNLNTFLNIEQQIAQHNIERRCVVKLMENLFKKINNLSKYKIFIISDHGSRITGQKQSSLSSIFAFKDIDSTRSKKIDLESIIQKIFKIKYHE